MIKQIEIAEKTDVISIKSLEIALSTKCNLRCKYCGAYNDRNIYKKRLSVDQIIEILDTISTLERIKLSGGEVTIDIDGCKKLGEYCKGRNLFYQINTNETLLTHKDIMELKNSGLSALHISLNFTDAISYKRYYGVEEEIFEKIVSNIRFASTELECVAETLVFDKTLPNLVEINRVVAELGVEGHEIQYGINQLNWQNGVSRKDVENFIFELCEKKAEEILLYFSCFEFPEACKSYSRFEKFMNRNDIFFTNCIEGKQQFHLSDNGDVVSCELIDTDKLGNIFEGFEINSINGMRDNEKKRCLETCYHCRKKFYFS